MLSGTSTVSARIRASKQITSAFLAAGQWSANDATMLADLVGAMEVVMSSFSKEEKDIDETMQEQARKMEENNSELCKK